MAYVSCKYGPPPELESDKQMIVCTDEAGLEWWVPPDSQVGEWLRFVEDGGTVDPYEPPTPDEPPPAPEPTE
jgi:hypothetical protein